MKITSQIPSGVEGEMALKLVWADARILEKKSLNHQSVRDTALVKFRMEVKGAKGIIEVQKNERRLESDQSSAANVRI